MASLLNLPHLPFTFPSSSPPTSSSTSTFIPPLSLIFSPQAQTPQTQTLSSITMKKLLKSLNPKKILKNRKSPSLSMTKSAPASFGSSSYSSSDSSTTGPPPGRTRSQDMSLRTEPWTEEAFKMIDLDGDGKITRFELHSLFKRVRVNAPSLSEEEIVAMIKDIDADGDGCISLKELETVGSALDPTAADEGDLKDAFDFFDADHDGKISAEELHKGFLALGDERCTLQDCRRMIEGVDKNRDGFVCFQDFSRMMNLPR